MPAPLLYLAGRNATAAMIANATSNAATNPTAAALHVVCAWPVSGQYGPGSRVLYYVLVAACVFARKTDWLRNACLAAALLFPAVAALHGLVLAAVHVNDVVDMDVYGAFQLCSIGILAAPITVIMSRTYFNDPGRNTIFLWTGLILTGLVSLTVEFYRATPTPCTHDDAGNPISANARDFPYGEATCGLICSVDEGPYSPMRRGSTNNIYVIPAPAKLSFNTSMLLAAACCIPAILSLIFTWIKILEVNWDTRNTEEKGKDAAIAGTNGATVGKMKDMNEMVRSFLSVIEAPVFSAAVLAILCMGEINFFSAEVRYQTEPMASIGQWAPVVGTVLAALGSLYLLLNDSPTTPIPDNPPPYPVHHCNCSHQHPNDENQPSQGQPIVHLQPTVHLQPSVNLSRSSQNFTDDIPNRSSHDLHMAPTVTSQPPLSPPLPAANAGRTRITNFFTAAGNKLGTAAHKKFGVDDFKHGPAAAFPEIPGEPNRNPDLSRIRSDYERRVAHDPQSGLSMVGSSASSFVSAAGGAARDGDARTAVGEGFGSPRVESPGRLTTRVRSATLEVPSPALR